MTDTGFPGSLERQALRLGRLVRVEEELVAVLGAQLARADDESVVVALADRIRCHRAAAEVVRDRLPVLREFPVDQLVGGRPLPGWGAALDGLRADAPEDALGREPGLTSALVAAYRQVAADAGPVAAPSVRRHLSALADALGSAAPGGSSPMEVDGREPLVREILQTT